MVAGFCIVVTVPTIAPLAIGILITASYLGYSSIFFIAGNVVTSPSAHVALPSHLSRMSSIIKAGTVTMFTGWVGPWLALTIATAAGPSGAAALGARAARLALVPGTAIAGALMGEHCGLLLLTELRRLV